MKRHFIEQLARDGSRGRLIGLGLVAGGVLCSLVVLGTARRSAALAAEPAPARPLDPAAWGSDHVGQPLPEYMESGECLFCHRDSVGTTWGKNKHNRTIRDAEASEPAIAALTRRSGHERNRRPGCAVLGDTRANRFLKRSGQYGKVDVLSTTATFTRTRRAAWSTRETRGGIQVSLPPSAQAAMPRRSIPKRTRLRPYRLIATPATAMRPPSMPTTQS